MLVGPVVYDVSLKWINSPQLADAPFPERSSNFAINVRPDLTFCFRLFIVLRFLASVFLLAVPSLLTLSVLGLTPNQLPSPYRCSSEFDILRWHLTSRRAFSLTSRRRALPPLDSASRPPRSPSLCIQYADYFVRAVTVLVTAGP